MRANIILPVKKFGIMTVYERTGYRSLGCPKYVVFRGDAALEEFKTKRKALRWAKDNQKG